MFYIKTQVEPVVLFVSIHYSIGNTHDWTTVCGQTILLVSFYIIGGITKHVPIIIVAIIREQVTFTYNNIILCIMYMCIPTRVCEYFEDFLI